MKNRDQGEPADVFTTKITCSEIDKLMSYLLHMREKTRAKASLNIMPVPEIF